MRETDSQFSASDNARRYSTRRQYLSLAFLILTTAALLLTVMFAARASAGRNSVSSLDKNEASEAVALEGVPQDYSKFSHTSPGDHASFANASSCDSCHQRNGTQAQPSLPGHKACIGCHTVQFTAGNGSMCSICHTGDISGSSPPVKGFPGLRSFRVSFDHAQHTRIGANCARCHAPARRGVALSIPASLSAHSQCYSCHSPGQSASSLSSCGTCHSVGGYSRTSSNARAFNFSFSHATHGARQRLSCANCHNVSAGAPQSRQVSSPATFQHFPRSRAQSCANCHNGQRAFGESDFGDCKKCHKGQTFRMGG